MNGIDVCLHKIHYVCLSQSGQLLATVLLFLNRDQLTLVDEDITTVPHCPGEHCFAHSIHDVAVQDVVAVRPYMPTRIFIKENNEWRTASQVYTIAIYIGN